MRTRHQRTQQTQAEGDPNMNSLGLSVVFKLSASPDNSESFVTCSHLSCQLTQTPSGAWPPPVSAGLSDKELHQQPPGFGEEVQRTVWLALDRVEQFLRKGPAMFHFNMMVRGQNRQLAVSKNTNWLGRVTLSGIDLPDEALEEDVFRPMLQTRPFQQGTVTVTRRSFPARFFWHVAAQVSSPLRARSPPLRLLGSGPSTAMLQKRRLPPLNAQPLWPLYTYHVVAPPAGTSPAPLTSTQIEYDQLSINYAQWLGRVGLAHTAYPFVIEVFNDAFELNTELYCNGGVSTTHSLHGGPEIDALHAALSRTTFALVILVVHVNEDATYDAARESEFTHMLCIFLHRETPQDPWRARCGDPNGCSVVFQRNTKFGSFRDIFSNTASLVTGQGDLKCSRWDGKMKSFCKVNCLPLAPHYAIDEGICSHEPCWDLLALALYYETLQLGGKRRDVRARTGSEVVASLPRAVEVVESDPLWFYRQLRLNRPIEVIAAQLIHRLDDKRKSLMPTSSRSRSPRPMASSRGGRLIPATETTAMEDAKSNYRTGRLNCVVC
jgi:hypothetical protein